MNLIPIILTIIILAGVAAVLDLSSTRATSSDGRKWLGNAATLMLGIALALCLFTIVSIQTH